MSSTWTRWRSWRGQWAGYGLPRLDVLATEMSSAELPLGNADKRSAT